MLSFLEQYDVLCIQAAEDDPILRTLSQLLVLSVIQTQLCPYSGHYLYHILLLCVCDTGDDTGVIHARQVLYYWPMPQLCTASL